MKIKTAPLTPVQALNNFRLLTQLSDRNTYAEYRGAEGSNRMKTKRSNSKRVMNRARSAGSHERLVMRLCVQTQDRRGRWITRSRHALNAQGEQDAHIEQQWHSINDRAVRVEQVAHNK